MNYADIKQYDIANGPGIRVSLFVSGCTHACKGCFNYVAWDFNYGQKFGEEQIEHILKSLEPSYIKGFTVLGGEPMEYSNQEGILLLLKRVREVYPELSIWCYSGYLFDKDIVDRMCKENPNTRELLSYIDMIVDGPFVEELKSLNLRFRGSSNQRIIKVKESLEAGTVVLWEQM